MWVLPLVETNGWANLEGSSLESFHDAVGYRGGFDGRADVVGANDVGAGEDGGYVGGGGGVEAILH